MNQATARRVAARGAPRGGLSGSQLGRRLDVDEDVPHGPGAADQAVLDAVGDRVAFADGQVRVDLDVDVHEVLQARLADAQGLDAEDAGDVQGLGADRGEQVGVGLAVHEDLGVVPEQPGADPEDRPGDGRRGGVVGPVPGGTAPLRRGHAREHGERAEGVEAIVPGRREQCGRAGPAGDAAGPPVEALLEDRPARGDRQGEPLGRPVRASESREGLPADRQGQGDQDDGDPLPGQRLDAGVPVRMLAVGAGAAPGSGPRAGRTRSGRRPASGRRRRPARPSRRGVRRRA